MRAGVACNGQQFNPGLARCDRFGRGNIQSPLARLLGWLARTAWLLEALSRCVGGAFAGRFMC
jgi:hypothetical protein